MRDWRSRRPVSGRRDSYDEALLQQGLATDSRFPEDDAHNWDWGSPEDPANNSHIAQFGDAIKDYRVTRLVVTYAAGALLLSRVVAVADIIRIRKMSASSAGIQTMVTVQASSHGGSGDLASFHTAYLVGALVAFGAVVCGFFVKNTPRGARTAPVDVAVH